MGFTRKALFVATAGLSGRVFNDNSKKERTAKADAKRVRRRKQTKVTRPKPQAARRPKPQAARRPKQRAAPASTVAPIVGSGGGTTTELERLADLHGRGALTDEEFAAAKAKILGTSPPIRAADRGPATFPAVEADVAAARDLSDLVVHDSRS